MSEASGNGVSKMVNYRLVPTTEPPSFEDFVKQHNLDLVVRERPPEYVRRGLPRYYAEFEYVEVKGEGTLIGVFGDGNTPEEAIEDYKRRLLGQTIVLHAFSRMDRREFRCPNQWE